MREVIKLYEFSSNSTISTIRHDCDGTENFP